MPRHLSLVTCAFAAFAAFAFQIHGANAQDLNCSPSNGKQKKVEGNVQIAVPCELIGTEVKGDIILYAGGSLIARDVHIKGSLEASRADFVDLDLTKIDGDIRLEELVGDSSSIERTEIRGGVLLLSNRSRLEVLNNEMNRGMQALGNSGGVLIVGNTVRENLDCAANTPSPLGVGNRVSGQMTGQCEDLQAEAPQSAPTPQPPTAPPSQTPEPPTTPATGGESTPPAPTPTDTFVPDLEGGGGGAMGWPALLLLPLVLWRRFARR